MNKLLPSSDSLLEVLAPFLRSGSFGACPRSPVFPSPKHGAVSFSFSGVTYYFWPKCYWLFLMQEKQKQKQNMAGRMFFLIYFYKFYYTSDRSSRFKKKKNFQTSSFRSVKGEQQAFVPITYDTARGPIPGPLCGPSLLSGCRRSRGPLACPLFRQPFLLFTDKSLLGK